jgi:hypothetical protein
LGPDCKRVASENILKGFRIPIEEQETIGHEPRTIEIVFLADECLNYLRVKNGTSFIDPTRSSW